MTATSRSRISAQRQGISKKYLEQIVPMLGRADVLRTTRGYQGGYRLARAPQEYTVGEILRLTEAASRPVACLDQHPNAVPALRRMRHPANVGGAGAGHPQLSRWHHAAGSA
ncbi:MAG: RrF2 family transcriptional regulator [Oscillospiraceae bacterium]